MGNILTPPTNVPEQQPVIPPPICQPDPAVCAETKNISPFPFLGQDSSERLLLREGVIDYLQPSMCGNPSCKNVILVIGDGMGWEMVRAGSIARQVLDELEEAGCNTKTGCVGEVAEAAKAAFVGRTTADYYTEGPGSGLSFQELEGFALATTTATMLQSPEPGNRYAPSRSMLRGEVTDHEPGMAPLALDKCCQPINFSPLDFEANDGNMVLWDDVKGGEFPWDKRYYQEYPDRATGFDPEYIMRHATGSAPTASSMATGHKAASSMLSQNLYEQDVTTIVEDAMYCGKAAGVVTSVPILHGTPAAFITHSNDRGNRNALRRSFQRVNPTLASGICGNEYYPFLETLQEMRNGTLSSMWTLLEQSNAVQAENFYDSIGDLDPDNGDHLLVCLGGDYTQSGENNLPYRGVDSTYSNRWCSQGVEVYDFATGMATGVKATTSSRLCNHYSQREIQKIPHISRNVKAALDFLGKDKDGFFFMYEQGDIDKAAHANHMDDMLGTMLDIDDGVRVILEWIAESGGWEKNALYVTADHDHYLTLKDDFPEKLANLLINGESHNITPQNNSDVNAWKTAIEKADRHKDQSKTVSEHIADFTTWSEQDVANVGHFWGTDKNGWSSHSTRPVPLYYAGDDGCIEALTGTGFQVLGHHVEGHAGKVDQVHIHACMLRNLFGL